jgi:preprotein translocase subunit SecA
MRLFGGDRMTAVFSSLGVEEDLPIEHRMLSNAIETAQKRVEGRNFSIRKHVLEYDDVMNKQREVIYGQRRKVLEGEDLHGHFQKMIQQLMRETMLDFCAGLPNSADWDIAAIQAKIADLFGELPALRQLSNARMGLDAEKLTNELTEEALARYENRAEEIGSADLMRDAERFVLLRTVDSKWMDHIDAMDDLRDSIGMRGYAQHDPVAEYRKEGFTMFEAMNQAIQEDAVRLMMRARFSQETVTRRQSVVKNLAEGHGAAESAVENAKQANVQSDSAQSGHAPAKSGTASVSGKVPRPGQAARASAPANGGQTGPATPAKRDKAKVGRNDPCPCGSGKKYKNCHGRQEA